MMFTEFQKGHEVKVGGLGVVSNKMLGLGLGLGLKLKYSMSCDLEHMKYSLYGI